MEDVISQENNPLKSDEKQITVDSNIHRRAFKILCQANF